ncbi:hypothetical protein QUF72_19135 [Desulfobacterales bacterium HSG2]|nr:hypothetical protein [Desulfobacterales bacterium HSG2]
MADVADQVKRIAQDLLNLEVNTIIKPNMTGRKMPSPRHALTDIAQTYNLKLIDIGLPLKRSDITLGSFKSYDMIREKAVDGIEAIKERIAKKSEQENDEAELVMLIRVKRMSDQIKGVFKSLEKRGAKQWDNNIPREDMDSAPPLELTAGERVLIRKIWDVGLEEIAMQTVIQMDGDVITRIQNKYVNEESIIIHKLHNESVSTSLRFWSELVGIVEDFFGKLSRSFS